jgi:hypothetical protein
VAPCAITLDRKIRFLIDRWCERRELEPLRRLLNGRASINGLTDGWNEMRDELRTIRARHKALLKDDELSAVIEITHIIEGDILKL